MWFTITINYFTGDLIHKYSIKSLVVPMKNMLMVSVGDIGRVVFILYHGNINRICDTEYNFNVVMMF